MQEIIDGLKKLSFRHPELEKRRLQILDALEHRCSIPTDEADTWILNKVTKGLLPKELDDKIDQYYKDTLYDAMIEDLLKRIDTQYPNKREHDEKRPTERAWFESLTYGQKCIVVLFENNHKKLH